MITRAGGTANVNFKYIVFSGKLTFGSGYAGSSTIVGQANANGAITAGAAQIVSGNINVESFSSVGGTSINGIIRNKPDFLAPDGVETTVNMGSKVGPTGNPLFYGTSAAAPHLGAMIGLLMEGLKKYSNQTLTPSQIKNLLKSGVPEKSLSCLAALVLYSNWGWLK